MKFNIDVNNLKIKIEKIGSIVLRGAAAIGMIALLGKVNDELGKYGVHVGYSSDGGLDIKAGGKKKPEPAPSSGAPKIKRDNDDWTFNAKSVQERSIVELMYAAQGTYSESTKRKNAEMILDIARNADEDARLVAIRALSRIAKGTYSDGVKSYVSSAIAEIGSMEPNNENEAEAGEVPNED